MGKKPRGKAPSTSAADGVLLHRSLTGISATEIAGNDKMPRDKAPFTPLVEGGLFQRSPKGIRAIAVAGKKQEDKKG